MSGITLNVFLALSLFFANEDSIIVSIDGGGQIVIPANSTFEVESVEYLVDDKIFILREPAIFRDGFEDGDQQ